ncbi:MAG TPA: ABC transporter permease subunit [Candidatus Thalassarchaeaceae archaeon]|jgi:ABC-type transport system involved in multi-copper enzyme maturation permease subunit|nr:ABC transporter permease subunit [Candidatus Thalassarchaeaceae archaeon]HJM20004.1 ABC transporter permease subunit [Candidatus Thalassarchaeaceae archaeon]HJM86712.1 ABC transporter permease subunit [Candidatus Thalassarchaeaceae archaeon]
MSRVAREKKILRLSWIEAKMHFRSPRMLALMTLLLLFIVGGSWGLSDPSAAVTSELQFETPYEILFLVSLFVLFSATLGVVLLGFDGISRKRLTGELAIELSQPIDRFDLARSQLQGLWLSVFIPTAVACAVGTLLIKVQIDELPSLYDWIYFMIPTGLIIFWYACIQLLASSIAKDLGSSVTLGVGIWMLFTLVWLLLTAILATFMGVDITDFESAQYNHFSDIIDLLSPNGVYQLLLEGNLDADARPQLSQIYIWASAILWSIIPGMLFLRRFKRLRP